MTLSSKLKGAALRALVSTTGDKAVAAVAEVRRRLAREPRRVDFYYDPADPWSHLTAQVVARLAQAYPVDFEIHIITPPASDVDPMPELRKFHAVRDARDLALRWDVDFPSKGDADPAAVRKTAGVLVKPRPFAERLQIAIDLGALVWANDQKGMLPLLGRYGVESSVEVPPILNASYGELRKRGHYHGAMLHWAGEWYWGIDRIALLQQALARDTGITAPPVLTRRAPAPPERIVLPPPAKGAPAPDPARAHLLPVDFWFSFRSPYSYLALDRVAALATRYPIDLRLRPIVPMIARGLGVPTVKQRYIVRDAKREADRLGVPFGTIADPAGKGAEHCVAVSRAAIAAGRGLEFLRSAATGIWAEALDMASYVDLRVVVERAGLSWEAARAAIADESWRAWAQENADDLRVVSLWGVPSFRVGAYVTWGQDRIELLDDRLRRHFAAPVPEQPPKSP